MPSQQPTANLEVSWRNEIASDGIDSHQTALTLSSQQGRLETGRKEKARSSVGGCTLKKL